jgi:hypothetical protein
MILAVMQPPVRCLEMLNVQLVNVAKTVNSSLMGRFVEVQELNVISLNIVQEKMEVVHQI